MGCFALAALLADAQGHMKCTLINRTPSKFGTPMKISPLLTVFCLRAGVVCLPDRVYIAAMFGMRLWRELDFSSLCIMLH